MSSDASSFWQILTIKWKWSVNIEWWRISFMCDERLYCPLRKLLSIKVSARTGKCLSIRQSKHLKFPGISSGWWQLCNLQRTKASQIVAVIPQLHIIPMLERAQVQTVLRKATPKAYLQFRYPLFHGRNTLTICLRSAYWSERWMRHFSRLFSISFKSMMIAKWLRKLNNR